MDRIVQMRKQAAQAPEQGPSPLEIYFEMKKIAQERAARNLGLAPKQGEESIGQVLQMLFAGHNPLEKLCEVAAHYYVDRITGAPPRSEA